MAKNSRRAILPVLKAMAGNIKTMATEWGGSIATRTPDAETGRWRKRTDAELPENSIEEWERLITFMTVIRNQTDSVIAHAEEQRDRLKAQEVAR